MSLFCMQMQSFLYLTSEKWNHLSEQPAASFAFPLATVCSDHGEGQMTRATVIESSGDGKIVLLRQLLICVMESFYFFFFLKAWTFMADPRRLIIIQLAVFSHSDHE